MSYRTRSGGAASVHLNTRATGAPNDGSLLRCLTPGIPVVRPQRWRSVCDRAARPPGERPTTDHVVAGPRPHGGRRWMVEADHGRDRSGRVHDHGDDTGGHVLRCCTKGVAVRAPAGRPRVPGHGCPAGAAGYPGVAHVDAQGALLRSRQRVGTRSSAFSTARPGTTGCLSWRRICAAASSARG